MLRLWAKCARVMGATRMLLFRFFSETQEQTTCFFHAWPVGGYRVLFSDNISCRMLGSEALMVNVCARLGVEPGQVSAIVSAALSVPTQQLEIAPGISLKERR